MTQQEPSNWQHFARNLIKSGKSGKLEGLVDKHTVITKPDNSIKVGEIGQDTYLKCLDALRYVEEYFDSSNASSESLSLLDLLDSNQSAEDLLKALTTSSSEVTGDNEKIKTKLRDKLAGILTDERVRSVFFDLLTSEVKKLVGAKGADKATTIFGKLKRTQLLKQLETEIARKINQLYLKDVRGNGKLSATGSETIGKLEKKRQAVLTERRTIEAQADEPTKSWLLVQELLDYKRQIKEKGFAVTPSRKKLLDSVLNSVMHGEKVFLAGSTGTGKTQLAMLVADLVNDHGYEVVSWHEGSTPRDLFGYREVGQDEHGIKSGTKPGPVSIAIKDGKIVIHDEYTTGQTRAQLSAKALLNAKPGQKVHIPGFNGELFEVKEGFGEIFTGNIKDERTKQREEMDPAIARMLKGLKVPYMPADELFKIILAELIDELGFLPLSLDEIKLIKSLTNAAELMQQCHDREVDGLPEDQKQLISQIFGNSLEDVHLDKNFLDTGTLLRLFQGWDLERAKGVTFSAFIHVKVTQFLADPKFDADKQERALAKTILKLSQVIGDDDKINFVSTPNVKPFILPSEVANLISPKLTDTDPLGDEDPTTPPIPSTTETNINTPDKRWLTELVENHYNGAADLVRAFTLTSQDKPIPAKAELLKAVLKELGPKEIAVLKTLEEPTLHLEPIMSLPRLTQGLNNPSYKQIPSQNDVLVGPHSDYHAGNIMTENATRDRCTDQKVIGYRFIITEGAVAPRNNGTYNSASQKRVNERIEEFEREYAGTKVKGLNYKGYAMQILKWQKQGIKGDNYQESGGTWSVLNGEASKNGCVANGYWYNAGSQSVLGYEKLNLGNDRARLRPSVIGNI